MSVMAYWVVMVSLAAVIITIAVMLWVVAIDFSREEGGFKGYLALVFPAALTAILLFAPFLETAR